MEKIFRKINNYGLNPNQFYVLYCISKGLQAENVNLHLELRPLKKLGLIDKTTLLITPAGIELLNDVQKEEVKAVSKKPVVEADMIMMYLELWPKIKLPSGKPARSDRRNIETRFKWFFTNYSYTWDTVMKATAMYIEEYEAKGYKFMRTSEYFIRKSDADKSVQSELANYCSLLDQGGYTNPESVFTDKVV